MVLCLRLGSRSSTSVTLILQVSQENQLLSQAICLSVPDPSSEEKAINRRSNGGHVGLGPPPPFQPAQHFSWIKYHSWRNGEKSAGSWSRKRVGFDMGKMPSSLTSFHKLRLRCLVGIHRGPECAPDLFLTSYYMSLLFLSLCY